MYIVEMWSHLEFQKQWWNQEIKSINYLINKLANYNVEILFDQWLILHFAIDTLWRISVSLLFIMHPEGYSCIL